MNKEIKSIFISDLHLGDSRCSSKELLSFLKTIECENLFLVGDIIDGWTLTKRAEWTTEHSKIIRRLVKLSYKTNIIYIVGNHDDFIKPFLIKTFKFGNISFHRKYKYKNYIIAHGDQYDPYMYIPKHIWKLFPPFFNKISNITKSICTTEYWAKKCNKKYKAIICGHTHVPKISKNYINCGDWISSLSYVVEYDDESMELLYWKNNN